MGQKYPLLFPMTCSLLGGLSLFLGVAFLALTLAGSADLATIVFATILLGIFLVLCSTVLLVRSRRQQADEVERITASADALINGRPIQGDESLAVISSLKEFAERQNEIAVSIRKIGKGDFGSIAILADSKDPVSMAVISLANDLRSALLTPEKKAQLERSLAELSEIAAAVSQGDLTLSAAGESGATASLARDTSRMIHSLSVHIRGIKESTSKVDLTIAGIEATAATLIRNCADHLSQAEAAAGAFASHARRSAGIAESAVKVAAPMAEFGQRARSIAEDLSDNITTTQSIRLQVQESLKRTKRLGERSQELSQIVFDLEELAERVNILALNASLRSSVDPASDTSHVSGELEQTAERTTKMTRRIAQLSQAISSETREASSSMESMVRDVILGATISERSMRSSNELALELSDVDRQISLLTESIRSQAKAIEDLSRSMTGAAETAEMIRAGSRNTAEAIQSASKAAIDLQTSVGVFKLNAEILPAEAKELENNRFVH